LVRVKLRGGVDCRVRASGARRRSRYLKTARGDAEATRAAEERACGAEGEDRAVEEHARQTETVNGQDYDAIAIRTQVAF
jgi:hypothetical protein